LKMNESDDSDYIDQNFPIITTGILIDLTRKF